MDNLSFLFPSWYIILCVGFALALSLLLYYGKSKDWTSSQKWILGSLRFIAAFLIAILLMSPLLKNIEIETKKPVLALLLDGSSSMIKEDGDNKKKIISEFTSSFINDCAIDYEVVTYSFNAELHDTLDFDFKGKETNISKALSQVHESLLSENLGGIVLVSDGIYNEGSNPIYISDTWNTSIFSVGVGDTTLQKDIILKSVVSNDVAYLGDKFTTEVNIKSLYCGGQSVSLKTYVIEEGKSVLLKENKISFKKNIDFVSKDVIVRASKPGILHLRYVVSTVAGEQLTSNNTKDVFVEVIDARNKILVLANAPHPDLTALKSSLESNKNYTVEVAFPNSFNGVLNDYNLIIYHQLPSAKYPISNIINEVKKNKLPFFIIGGSQINISKANEIQSISNAKASWNNPNNAKAVYNSGFTYFNLEEESIAFIEDFNPLDVPFGNFYNSGNGQVLFNQKIGSVETKFPLWVFGKSEGVKSSVLYGEGLWRWRLYDYMKNKSFENFDNLINKTVQYLTVKEDKRKFKVNTSRKVYNENESISFFGYLFNDSYEKIVKEDISLKVLNSKGEEFDFVFDKNSENYTVNIGRLPADSYKYKASVQHNGETLNKNGKFIVKSIQLESYNLTADFGMLNKLSQESNGAFYTLDNSSDLIERLTQTKKIKPTLYESLRTNPVINLKWYFFFIALLLVIEWFLRRYFGSY